MKLPKQFQAALASLVDLQSEVDRMGEEDAVYASSADIACSAIERAIEAVRLARNIISTDEKTEEDEEYNRMNQKGCPQ